MTYRIRPFLEVDRDAAGALGNPVIDWWHTEVPDASLHLVAETIETGELVGHLQVRDRGVPKPSHRPGQCQISLTVAPEHRRRGIGGSLYERIEAFARGRRSATLYAGYLETGDAPGRSFLERRGFEPLERFLPSYIELGAFDPERFAGALQRVEAQQIILTTYDQLGDGAENRRRLYMLEETAHASQPFRETEPYCGTPYAKWEADHSRRDPTAIFLALAPVTGGFVGVVTALEWYFTGIHPEWRGRGIATALKVQCLREAKRRGLGRTETENQQDNAAMIAVNRKLGFVFTDEEVACIKHLSPQR